MEKSRRRPGKFILFFLLLITSFCAGNAFADIIIDNGGSGTSSNENFPSSAIATSRI